MSEAENWVPIPGFKNRYEVSDWGRVRSRDMLLARSMRGIPVRKEGRILKPSFSYGYPYVSLCGESKQKRMAVAVLVCTAFHGDRPLGHEVAHGDGDSSNASATNLRWATAKENAADKRAHGTEPLGEVRRQAKISEHTAKSIKHLLSDGKSQHQIARFFGVGRGTVCEISRGRTWRHI